jgi:hypothetical protein
MRCQNPGIFSCITVGLLRQDDLFAHRETQGSDHGSHACQVTELGGEEFSWVLSYLTSQAADFLRHGTIEEW